MKRFKLIIPALLFSLGLYSQNIPNGDFEDWTRYNHYALQDYWSSSIINVSRTTDHMEGAYALRLDNTVSEDGLTKRRCYVQNRITSIGQDGFEFYDDVLSLAFSAKYELAIGDTARIYVRFRENGATKGFVDFYMWGSSGDEFNNHKVPIFWYGSRTPDIVEIYIYSNIHNNVDGNGFIIVDDLHFENIGKRAADITNFGFEDWVNDGIDHPVSWRPLDLITLTSYNYFLGDTGVTYSTDAFNGERSLKVGNYYTNANRVSYAYVGTENDHYYTPAFKVYKRYKHLQGYYKYVTDANDSGRIQFRTFYNGVQRSYSNFYLRPTNNWTFFSQPITYYGSFQDSIPDSACIIAWSGVGTPQSQHSFLLLDDLDLVMEPHSASIDEPKASIGVYPNPFADRINLDLKESYQLTISSTKGEILRTMNLHAGTHQLNLSDLSKGIYILTFNNSNRQWKSTILKP
ncbi:MAG: T9SS type A sorting domain-containing protein [Bacteroidia bacterium]